jgi:hypothetical protein
MVSMDRASGPQPQLTFLNSVPDVYTAYIWKNVAITLWFGPATLESCAILERGCRKQAAEHPEGLSLVNIMIPGGRSMPSAAVRSELARIMREHTQNAAAIAVIIPGSGFWASALRSLIVALSMLRPREMPLQIFGSAPPLVEWLLPLHAARTGLQLEAAELLAALRQAEREAAAIKAQTAA